MGGKGGQLRLCEISNNHPWARRLRCVQVTKRLLHARRHLATRSSAAHIRHTHTSSELLPLQRGIAKVRHRPRCGAGSLDTLAHELNLEDLVRIVEAHDRQHTKALSRLRPQRLTCIHARPISLQVNDDAVGASYRGTNRHGHANANRAAGESEVREWRALRGCIPVRAATRERLVDEDGVLWLVVRDNCAQMWPAELGI
mmetsp:Transcript_15799/g.40091  ORF Transcript_15799/g.40091 Transcript_15799/m.40091 type:complete len:200 (+) Transcript_15799:97-696(+)